MDEMQKRLNEPIPAPLPAYDLEQEAAKIQAGIQASQQAQQAQQPAEDPIKAYDKRARVADYIDEYLAELEYSKTAPYISTGFSNLDDLLGGGLRRDFIILGGTSSSGKTTFALQMAVNLARSGHDVMIESLEMSRRAVISKMLSYLMAQKSIDKGAIESMYGKTAQQIDDGKTLSLSGTEKECWEGALGDFRGISKNLYIYEAQMEDNGETIRKAVGEHVKLKGRAPIVIVDYLQKLSPVNQRRTSDKEIIDDNLKALQFIKRDYKTSIIVISSMNRSGYSKDATTSDYKGSGNIEFDADIALTLQYEYKGNAEAKDITDDKRESRRIPRLMEVSILKNRMNCVNENALFDYDPRFNMFTVRENETTLEVYKRENTGSGLFGPPADPPATQETLKEPKRVSKRR